MPFLQGCFYCPFGDKDKDTVFLHMNSAHMAEVMTRVGGGPVKTDPLETPIDQKDLTEIIIGISNEDNGDSFEPSNIDREEDEQNIFDTLQPPPDVDHVKNRKRKPETDEDGALLKKIKITEQHRITAIDEVVRAPFEELDLGEEKLPFPCYMCPRRFKRAKDLKAHDLKIHGISNLRILGYACNECSALRQVDFRPHLVKHMRKFHIHPCHLCQAELTTRFTLNLHLKHAHKVDVSQYCDFCTFQAEGLAALAEHVKSCHIPRVDVVKKPKPIFEVTCKLCPFRAPNKHELAKHMTDLHSQKKSRTHALFKFSCDGCDFRTYGMYEMFAHVQDWHNGQALEGNFTPQVEVKCFECSLQFSSRGALSEHLAQVHAYHTCPDCQMMSKEEIEDSHTCFKRVLGVSGAVRYYCNRCSYEGDSHKRSVIHQHANHSAKNRFTCDHCEFSCARKGVFEKHVKWKHLKVADFKCDICGFAFRNQTVLLRHRYTHFKDVVHKCNIGDCTYETSNTYLIGKHRKQHFVYDPEKTYEGRLLCLRCPYKAEKKSEMKRHEKTHEETK